MRASCRTALLLGRQFGAGLEEQVGALLSQELALGDQLGVTCGDAVPKVGRNGSTPGAEYGHARKVPFGPMRQGFFLWRGSSRDVGVLKRRPLDLRRMLMTEISPEAIREWLEREGVDIEEMIKEKRTLMERKQVRGNRVELSVLLTASPGHIEIKEEGRR